LKDKLARRSVPDIVEKGAAVSAPDAISGSVEDSGAPTPMPDKSMIDDGLNASRPSEEHGSAETGLDALVVLSLCPSSPIQIPFSIKVLSSLVMTS
jgi:hypothetical protein